MAWDFNTTEIETFEFNTTLIDRAFMNGTQIFEAFLAEDNLITKAAVRTGGAPRLCFFKFFSDGTCELSSGASPLIANGEWSNIIKAGGGAAWEIQIDHVSGNTTMSGAAIDTYLSLSSDIQWLKSNSGASNTGTWRCRIRNASTQVVVTTYNITFTS